jgi:DNA-directed RNA polymerase subunit RPC12/RpoP
MRFLLLLAVIAVVVWLVRRYMLARNQQSRIADESREAEPERLTEDDDDSERINCPRCAERIRRHAKMCRYCGHELSS